MSTIIDIPHR